MHPINQNWEVILKKNERVCKMIEFQKWIQSYEEERTLCQIYWTPRQKPIVTGSTLFHWRYIQHNSNAIWLEWPPSSEQRPFPSVQLYGKNAKLLWQMSTIKWYGWRLRHQYVWKRLSCGVLTFNVYTSFWAGCWFEPPSWLVLYLEKWYPEQQMLLCSKNSTRQVIPKTQLQDKNGLTGFKVYDNVFNPNVFIHHLSMK